MASSQGGKPHQSLVEQKCSPVDITPPDGRTYRVEVNPSPGYSWYEDATGQPISRALARWLAGGE